MGVKTYFKERGIESKDIPRGIIYFKGLSWLTWSGTFVLCYRVQPLRKFAQTAMAKNGLQRLEQTFPNAYRKCEQGILNTTQKLSQSKFFKPIPHMFRLSSRQFASALCENLVLYKLLLPIFIPLQLYTTVQLLHHHAIVNQQFTESGSSVCDSGVKE